MRARDGRTRERASLSLALFLLIASAASLGSARPVRAESVWTGPPISFTKPDGADPSLPSSQDAIVPGVSLTRGNSRGLYNAALESFFLLGASPADTEWAFESNNPALPESQIRAANHAALSFDDWATAHGQRPLSTLGRPGVLHVVSQDIYIDVTFTAWTSLSSGGSFAYVRSTAPVEPVPTTGPLGLGIAGLLLALGVGRRALRSSRLD